MSHPVWTLRYFPLSPMFFDLMGIFWYNQQSLCEQLISALSIICRSTIFFILLRAFFTQNWTRLNIHFVRMNCFELEPASNIIFSIKIPLRLTF